MIVVEVPVIGKIGSPHHILFQAISASLEGVISDTSRGAFLLELEMTRPMREKFASKLTWLEREAEGSPRFRRQENARIIPANPHSTLILADGIDAWLLHHRHVDRRRGGIR